MRRDVRFHFVLDARATRWPDIATLDETAIACEPHRFVGGRNSWIAQSFVRLRPALQARGWTATAGTGFAADAINIAHRDDVNSLAAGAHRAPFLLVVRADRGPAIACDRAIVQNGLPHRAHERFIPLWPQPRLIARDPARGARLECIAYEGRTGSSPAWFRDAALRQALARRGMRFEVREQGWGDYGQVDVALATRDELPAVLAQKPATKVYNGWLAGCAVLASLEPAYLAIRRSALDFLAIQDAEDVLTAIDFLRAHPAFYLAMIAHGRARAREFTVDAVRRAWLDLLDEEIVPAFLARRAQRWSRGAWFVGAMARQKLENRCYRARLGYQRLCRRAEQAITGFSRLAARGAPAVASIAEVQNGKTIVLR